MAVDIIIRNMRILRIISVSIFSIMAYIAVAAAYDIEVNGIYYNVDLTNMTASVTNNGSSTGCYAGTVTIPENIVWNGRVFVVNGIEASAFYGCNSLRIAFLPQTIQTIGQNAFYACSELEYVSLPDNIKSIGIGVFFRCAQLNNLILPNQLESMGNNCFAFCSSIESISIPSTVTKVDYHAFSGCSSLTSLKFEDSEDVCDCPLYGPEVFVNCPIETLYLGRSIKQQFYNTSGLKHLTIGPLVKKWETFYCGDNVEQITSSITEPSQLVPTFPNRVYLNATLKVPKGTKEAYSQAEGWKQFFSIEEYYLQACEAPVIEYTAGKLRITSSTPGAVCYYTINDLDMAKDKLVSDEIALMAVYNISAYATAPFYTDSPTSVAILCWLNGKFESNGISMATKEKRALLLSYSNGALHVSGLQEGEVVSLYTLSGVQIASQTAHSSSSTLYVGGSHKGVAIVKIGDESVKIQIK